MGVRGSRGRLSDVVGPIGTNVRFLQKHKEFGRRRRCTKMPKLVLSAYLDVHPSIYRISCLSQSLASSVISPGGPGSLAVYWNEHRRESERGSMFSVTYLFFILIPLPWHRILNSMDGCCQTHSRPSRASPVPTQIQRHGPSISPPLPYIPHACPFVLVVHIHTRRGKQSTLQPKEKGAIKRSKFNQ